MLLQTAPRLCPESSTACPPGAAGSARRAKRGHRRHPRGAPCAPLPPFPAPLGTASQAVGAHLTPKALAGDPAGASPLGQDLKVQRPSPGDSGSRWRRDATAVLSPAGWLDSGDLLSQGSRAGASASSSIET